MIGHISSKHQMRSEMVQCSLYPKMETQERICGLCLTICDNFKAIEGDMKDVLDVVLPKMDLSAIQELVMCTHCTEMLIKCSAFKTTCLNSYNCIVSFANCKDDIKLNLRDIYLSKNEIIAEDQIICGFCMNLMSNCSAISLDEREVLLEKMMERYLPELDLSLIEKPVICEPCHGSLKNCFYFVTNCLCVEEKIKKYCETQDITSRGQIELSRLLEFTARDVTTGEVNVNLVDTIKEEKQFCEENENSDEIIIDNERDIFKFEQNTCGDSEDAAEESKKFDGIEIQETFCGEYKTYFKEENLFEIENHEILESYEDTEMKTDEPDFIRFEENLDLSLSEVTTTINCKLYKCNFCSYQTKEEEPFKKHHLVHKSPSEVTMYKCDSCPYRATTKTHMLRHLLRHKDPSEVTMFTCDTCSYQSKYKDNVKKHLLAHKGMDPSKVTVYKCDTCSYQSKYKSSLTRHLLVHKEKDPLEITVYKYKCDFCLYRARKKHNFVKHLLRHKDPSEITMFTCDTCSYQSKYKSDLKKHLLGHKDLSEVTVYKCDFCSYQTKRKNGLKSHLLIHKDLSEVTVYKCDFCSYQTKRKNGLKSHLLRHKKSNNVQM